MSCSLPPREAWTAPNWEVSVHCDHKKGGRKAYGKLDSVKKTNTCPRVEGAKVNAQWRDRTADIRLNRLLGLHHNRLDQPGLLDVSRAMGGSPGLTW
jgi:hypothetical protein